MIKFKVIKKNQLAILVISLMLITAGYLNYDTNFGKAQDLETGAKPEESISLADIGDAELVNANLESTDKKEKEETAGQDGTKDIEEEKTNETSADIKTSKPDNYFAQSKLERNVMYSQMIERYQEIIKSSSQASDQKAIATSEINKINELQNAIMISENLLSSKGFSESVIFINGDSISIIVGKENLAQDEVAQIQNIVSRELKADVTNIHISTK